MNVRPLLLASVVALAGCQEVADPPEETRVPGTIELYSQPVVVSANYTVPLGQPIVVRVRTYGNGCVSRGDTEIQQQDLQATITPHDYQQRAQACPDILRTFEHEATLRFSRRGNATVVIRGNSLPANRIIERSLTISVL
jgi:hypothetical protein